MQHLVESVHRRVELTKPAEGINQVQQGRTGVIARKGHIFGHIVVTKCILHTPESTTREKMLSVQSE